MQKPLVPRFDAHDDRLLRALRERVDAYFSERGLSKHADARMVAKTVFFLGGNWALLALLSSGSLPALAALPLCLLLGVLLAGIGFNVGHDAIHGAYSKHHWVNKALGYSFDLMGASSLMWSHAHNVVHHTYTNVPGVDHDLEPGPWLLFYAREKPARVYRAQHVYAFVMYCFTALVWVFKKDLEQALSVDPRTGRCATAREVASVVGWKLLHLGLYLGLPLAFSGYAWWQVLAGYVTMLAAAGFTLAVVFQLAHVVEETGFPRPEDCSGRSWTAHQLHTTANFAPDSALVGFFCGGLNHQVEHHLFARICHVHYPAIAPLVREVALAHGLPYHQNPTFFAALQSHVRAMKRFGRPAGAAAA